MIGHCHIAVVWGEGDAAWGAFGVAVLPPSPLRRPAPSAQS